MIGRTAVSVLCVAIVTVSASPQQMFFPPQFPPRYSAPISTTENWKTVSNANYLSTFSIFKEVAQNADNVVISPLSLNAAMSLVHLGADGQTEREIRQVFHYPDDEEVMCTGSRDFLNRIRSAPSVTMKIANKVYMSERYNISEGYQNNAQRCFETKAERIDFSDSQRATKTINAWVENHTNSKIKNMVSPDAVGPSTSLMLLNAVYFKGLWDEKFDPARTSLRNFYVSDRDVVKNVPFMSRTGSYRAGYVAQINSRTLEIPYKGNDVTMLFIVPSLRRTTLEEVIDKLPSVTIEALHQELRPVEASVNIPKFTVETTTELNQPFKKMGINEMFTDNANFQKLSSDPVKVTRVFQKAFIEVNEEGSEAAAATGAIFVGLSLPPTYTVDQPFIFVIYQRSTNAILFAGKVTRPSSSN